MGPRTPNTATPPRAAAPRPPGRAVYIGAVLLIALAVGAYFVHQIGQVVLTLLLTLLLTVIVSGPVNLLARRGLSRGLALAVVAGAFGLVAWLLGLVAAPVVEHQARQLSNELPALVEDVEALAARSQEALGLDTEARLELSNLAGMGRDLLSTDVLSATAGVGMSVLKALSFGLVALVATIYLVVRPYPVVDGFVTLFPAGWRERTRRILGNVYRTVQWWLLGQLAAMAFIGVLTGTALWALGIPFAVLLGLFAGLVSFVPFLGAFVAAIPPVLLALVTDPVLALWVVLVYTAIQQVESHVIQPVVMSKAVALHPAVVVFGLLVMGTLFGVVGLVLAVPLVATVQVLVRELWVERMNEMGNDDPPKRENPEKPGPLRRAFTALRRLFFR